MGVPLMKSGKYSALFVMGVLLLSWALASAEKQPSRANLFPLIQRIILILKTLSVRPNLRNP